MIQKCTILLIFLTLLPVSALALPQHNPVPGGIALLTLPQNTDVTTLRYNNRKLGVFKQGDEYIALVGLPLSTNPGQHKITMTLKGKAHSQKFTVTDKIYEEQRLVIANKHQVNPDKLDLERINRERTRKNRARKHFTSDLPYVDFVWPLRGRISSVFGLRRFFNEQPRKPHTGLDIAATEGTPIVAVADGRVIETGDFFFSGNLVYLDHGMGLITLYAHMSRVDVIKGQLVKRGETIGAVGQTGRVTGAHLHLSVIANQSLVDPRLMLSGPDVANTK